MQHSKYGGSTAARTVNCPGWQKQSADVPREVGGPSPYAQAGTALHDIMESLLLLETDDDPMAVAQKFVGEIMHDTLITQDHIDFKIRPAWNAWQELVEQYGLVEYVPEVKCTYQDDIGGYADVIAVNPEYDTVAIVDWKFGFHPVSPENSHQGRFYAMAAAEESEADDMFHDDQTVVIAIIQPNTEEDTTALKTWETDSQAISDYEDEFLAAYDEAEHDNPSLQAGDHCKWCPAAPMCPEKTGEARLALMMQPDDLAALSQNMDMVPALKQWIKEVESAVYDQLEVGAPVPGWKLVAKQARSKWNDEQAALNSLKRKLGGIGKVTTAKLLSPAQIKKVAKAQGKDITWHLEKFEVKASSGSTLAPESDKRPAVLNADGLQAALNAIS